MALLFALLLLLASRAMALVTVTHTPVGSAPPLPLGTPHPPPDYMKDNVNNYWGSAPDKGSMDGPVLWPLNGSALSAIHNHTTTTNLRSRDNSDSFWISTLASAGEMPFAPSGYQFYRNVKDFGAMGDGSTDDTAAINRAVASFSSSNLGTLRCGAGCGSTSTLGAVVYFPEGTYLISTPIVQYYYTQFIGNPTTRPTIKGTFNFTGIALFDSDFYIPGGNSAEWYINQSNFYRQIRNFIFDMTGQNWTNSDNGQGYVPTGIHWQVGQATSITNCDFLMSVSTANQRATGVGIYMENGSGGFVSDLTFTGGNIGFVAGSQQFTASNLQFTSCLTAIFSQWNWGFTWKNIYVLSCYIALDCTSYSGITKQGTGSITVLDSHFNGVPYAITVDTLGDEQPNIVLDNLLVENSASVVLINGGATVLDGSSGPLYFNSWAQGYQYLPSGAGGKMTGFINPAPAKSQNLLDSAGAYFTRSKPQYETVSAGSIIVATQHGVSNGGTGDQSGAINTLLSGNVGSVIFFPAGVYMVKNTVHIPVGSIIVGSGWSQIMGTGSNFQSQSSPQVMVQVGNAGDYGVIEISDMLFTVQGPTPGAILMEWNVHESTQGSAGMWDSHFRVGGATGSDMQLGTCPAGASSVNSECMGASLLLHITSKASGYFENVWAWVADHDLDSPLNANAYESDEGVPLNVQTDISIYVARGILIESQGPTWLYGTASEHSQLYQYQISDASNIYLGHMQTETPYYQPNPVSTKPYTPGVGGLSNDPTFDDCYTDQCRSAWALRVINSTNVFIYSAGFYSFFQNNVLGCTDTASCQMKMIDTSYSQGLWIYNIFTKGNVQIVSPEGGLPPLLFNDTTQDGYTSEIAAWLALSTGGGNLGGGANGTGGDVVYVDPSIWPPGLCDSACGTPNQTPVSGGGSPPGGSSSSSSNTGGGSGPSSGGGSGGGGITVTCPSAPCTYVLPPITLPTPTTITFQGSQTSLEVGCFTSETYTDANGNVTPTSWYVSVTVTTILTIPPITVMELPVSNVPIVSGIGNTVIYPQISLVPPPFVVTDDDGPLSSAGISCIPSASNTRSITPKPWPWTTFPINATSTTSPTTTTPPFISITHTTGGAGPTCSGGCGSSCTTHCSNPCASGCNTNGGDCTASTCTQGSDCAGPTCTAGGDCDAPLCTRGGDCTGPKCDHGGHCEGPLCNRGGSCWGLFCHTGGDCIGPFCLHGGGCGPLRCPPGDCVGPACDTPGDDDDNDDDGDFTDSNDPNSVSSESEECTTSTYSDCRTVCLAGPQTDCSTSTTSCSDVIGCDTTGSSWASTITPAPGYALGTSDTWSTGTEDDSGAISVISWLSGAGDFGPMTGTPGQGTPTGGLPTGGVSAGGGTGNGGTGTGGGSGFPSLSGSPTSTGPAYSGSNCATYTTSEICNGSGEMSACETETLCVPTAPQWSTIVTQGSASCPGTEICISTSVVTLCEETEGGGNQRRAARPTPAHKTVRTVESVVKSMVTSVVVSRPVAAATSSSSSAARPEQKPGAGPPAVDLRDASMRHAVAADEQEWEQRSPAETWTNNGTSSTDERRLWARQNFGSDGCAYFLECAPGYCATITKVPCLQSYIQAITGALSGTDVEATVVEDGVTVCQASASCSIFDDIVGSDDCSGQPQVDCGNGNSMQWQWNFIEYTSAKYQATFPIYLSRTTTDKVVFCWQEAGLASLPSACIEDDFAYQNGPCQPYSSTTPPGITGSS